MDLNARAVLSAQVSSVPMFLSGGGSGHQTLSSRPRSPPACPGFIAGTLQLSNIRNLLRLTLWNWRAIVVSPDVGSVVSSRRLQRPCPPPRRMQRRNAPTLADGCNLSLTAYSRLNQCVSDSLVWLNVSPAACPALDRPACDLPSDLTDDRKGPAFC